MPPAPALNLWELVQLPLLAGLIGLLWGLSEIIGKFNIDTVRALRTGGSWVLLVVNFLAAALCFIVIAAFVAGANNWGVAIIVGIAWPTVIRNASIKLSQPLDGPNQEQAAVRFEQAYGQVQRLCQLMINKALTRQRLNLMTELLQLPLETLEHHARIALIASPLQHDQGMPSDNYIDQIMKKKDDETVKKALLTATVLNYFGRETLDDLLKQERKAQRSRDL